MNRKNAIQLVGKKGDMSQVFSEDGLVTPVTAVVVETSLEGVTVGAPVIATGTSKGRGFTGVVKRWGFAGGPATHGSGWSRKPGSVGGGTDPGRIYKGKKMPGRMGGKRVSVSGLKVVEVRPDQNEVLISGALPGHRNSSVQLLVGEVTS